MSPSGSYRTINGSVQVELPPRRTSDFTVMQIAHPYYPYCRPIAPLPTMAGSPPPPPSYNYHLHRSMPVSASVYPIQKSAWPSASTGISMDNRHSYLHSSVSNGNSLNSSGVGGGGGHFRIPQSPAFRFPPLPASLTQAGRAFEKDTPAVADIAAQQAALRASHKRKASVSSGVEDRDSARRRSNTAARFVSPGRRRDSRAALTSEVIIEAPEDTRVTSGVADNAVVATADTM
jgi:hypothetical protein